MKNKMYRRLYIASGTELVSSGVTDWNPLVRIMVLRAFGQRQRLGAKAPREAGRRRIRFETCDLKKK